MRVKIVIGVSIHCHKCGAKAMKIAVAMPGVESVALTGQEKDQLEVIGDGIDSVKLTRRLRKKVAHADILSVVEAKKVEQGKPNPSGGEGASGGAKPPVQQVGCYPPPPPTYYYYDARQPYGDGGCTIM